MATYGYGPPPPPPAGAPPQAYQQQYGQYQQPPATGHVHGGHAPRGGRGGHSGRGDFHGSPPSYPYNNQPQPPPSYTGPHHAPPPPHTPLAPQNYHPNYAPQHYQQPQYAHQQQYPHQQPQQPPQPPQQAPYAHHYPSYPQAPNVPPHQPWGGPATAGHQPAGPAHYGSGRGRGGHQGDRGGHKPAAAMGPPLRMGFDNRGPEPPALVSSATVYPPQPFGPPQGGAPYAPPPSYHPGYPQPGPPHMHAPGPPHYDPYQSGQHGGGRSHGRGGFHNSNRGRPHTGGDKMRHNNHKKPNGVPSTPQGGHQKPDAPSAGKKKKRKTNTLGLTPGDESDDDFNEEAKLVELIGPDAPNPTDIAAWIAERKANFPTQARIKALAAAAATSNGEKAKDGKDAAVSSLEKQKLKAEKLRKQLEKVESSIKRKREQQDEGDDMRDVKASPSSSDDSQSDSDKPEVLPSRPAVPPPSKKADPSKHCKYYSTGGVCGKKGKCRFVHDEAVRSAALREREMNGGRMTLQQRLTLNDKDQEDLTIVKTLQYLKEKGLIDQSGSTPSSQPNRSETSADLPPRPAVVATSSRASADPYQGWDLNGFGNSGARDSV
ncbi:hypothetical protein MCOR34_009719 [Pyricularia oryzae]|nr:hypothetical protein MCOR34_009719 [Pyricularia oryzae]